MSSTINQVLWQNYLKVVKLRCNFSYFTKKVLLQALECALLKKALICFL